MTQSGSQLRSRLALLPLLLGLNLAVSPVTMADARNFTETVTPALATRPAAFDLTGLAARLTWTNPAGTTQFQVQLVPAGNDGPGLNLIIGDPVQVAQSQFLISAPEVGNGNYILLPGMSYTWRVRTTSKLTSAGEYDPSWGPWAQGQFRTPAPSSDGLFPAAPPTGAALGSAAAVTLSWTHPSNAIFYWEVQVSGDTRFDASPASASSFVWWNLVHGGVSSPVNSWRTPALRANTSYFWRVRPRVQGDGQPVAWGPVWSFTTAASGAPQEPPASLQVSPNEALENGMLALVNQARAERGLGPLTMDVTIRSVARAHSQDMVDRNYFAHVTPEGIDPFTRLRAGGVQYSYAGENIGTSSTMERTHTALMASPSHLANIISPNYHRVGIGLVSTASGGVMITQNFAD